MATIPVQKTPPRIAPERAPLSSEGPRFAAQCEDWDEWDKPAPPLRIHGNSYLVGTCGIASILITGDDGHILIDSGTEAGAEIVLRNIRRLGFDPADVKILLHSHEHFDHVGGMARLAQATGAQVIASPEGARALARGIPLADDPQSGMHPPFPIAPADRTVTDGEEIRVGHLSLKAVATPGHSPGALSWTWGSCDGAICHQLVYAESLSPVSSEDYRFSDHPDRLAAYRASLAKVAALRCDILLTPHPSASNMIERLAGAAPLVDENGCRDYSEAIATRLDARWQGSRNNELARHPRLHQGRSRKDQRRRRCAFQRPSFAPRAGRRGTRSGQAR
ncbi:subclass B3 metallo-beta-lactamase [Sphingomicrobium lutaoense]|uniref:Metallo-beta-lactamase class B n=2 Tax=Sphingomicrobium lutaoense TaxID=515949 RepID=A0A839Z339_9SPHN|nr:subclass B3 metallo-beta-lactamase [Sphingomicrobium lutaoense]MBB3764487.1 metallo-beta-lactamase class B [Sphingomicrobium lutaoense]